MRSQFVAALAVLLVIAGNAGFPHPAVAGLVAYLGVALFINFAVSRKTGWITATLDSAPLVWLGQLSYSLYVWQQMFCYRSALPWIGHFPQNAVAALAVSCLSFYCIETPLARLRKRVPHIDNLGFSKIFRPIRPLVEIQPQRVRES